MHVEHTSSTRTRECSGSNGTVVQVVEVTFVPYQEGRKDNNPCGYRAFVGIRIMSLSFFRIFLFFVVVFLQSLMKSMMMNMTILYIHRSFGTNIPTTNKALLYD